jgi:hypothetical protein
MMLTPTRPLTLNVQPALVLVLTGGLVATVLLLALLHLLPAFGLAVPDLPRLIGGSFTSDAGTAFGLGAAIMIIGGAVLFPGAFYGAWLLMPGSAPGLAGALLNGAVFGVAVWLLAGLAAPLLGALNRVPELDSPGLFMLGAGVAGAAGVLAAHVAYGLALTLVAAMGRGISPVQTLGAADYGRAHGLAPHGPWTWRGPDGYIEPTRPYESD